jgi:hypothetical protein
MAPNFLTLNEPVADYLIVIQMPALPGMSLVIAVIGNGLNC